MADLVIVECIDPRTGRLFTSKPMTRNQSAAYSTVMEGLKFESIDVYPLYVNVAKPHCEARLRRMTERDVKDGREPEAYR